MKTTVGIAAQSGECPRRHRSAPLLTTPRAWQILDLLIAATMLLIAVKLATS